MATGPTKVEVVVATLIKQLNFKLTNIFTSTI